MSDVTSRNSEGRGAFARFLVILAGFALPAALLYASLVGWGTLPLAGDAGRYNYPVRAFYDAALGRGEFPLWNPYEAAGVPFVGGLQTGALYPPNLLLHLLLPAPLAYGLTLLLHYALAGALTYLYLRALGLGVAASASGGAAFELSGFMSSNFTHTALISSAAWLPLILLALLRLGERPTASRAAALALASAMQVLAGNAQICLYTQMVALLYAAYLAAHVPERRRFLVSYALAMAGALMIALPQLWAAAELASSSQRSADLVALHGYRMYTLYNVEPGTLASLLFPTAYSREVGLDQFLAYVGIPVMALGGAAALVLWRPGGPPRFFALIAAGGLALSVLGATSLVKIIPHLPVYGVFRAHGRNLLEFSFAASVLFAYGVEALNTQKSGRRIASAALAAIAAFLTIAVAFIFSPTLSSASGLENVTLLNPAFLVPLVLIALYAACLFAYRHGMAKAAIPILLLLFLAELFHASSARDYGPVKISELAPARVLADYGLVGTPDARYRLFTVHGGFGDNRNLIIGAAKLNAYDALMPLALAELLELEPIGYSRYADVLIGDNALLSLMGVRTIRAPLEMRRVFEGAAVDDGPPEFRLLHREEGALRLEGGQGRVRISHALEAGTYLISFSARSLGGRAAPLKMDAYAEADRALRGDIYPYILYPGLVGADPTRYERIVRLWDAERLYLDFFSTLGQAIEVRDMEVRQALSYGVPPMGVSGGPAYRINGEEAGELLVENINALPRAFAVEAVARGSGVHGIGRAFRLREANPARLAFVEGAQAGPLAGKTFTPGGVEIVSSGLHKVALRTDIPGPGFVVLADQYYPGWQAFVDSREAAIYRVDGVLRGVEVPAGRHEVIFLFRPVRWYAALAAGICALVLGLALMAVGGNTAAPVRGGPA